jgi:nitroimidazol reductase NimA-like FMN-containing flavoprotein (pyridoxamine 5'-phosphate oxidase superfamily)
MKQSGWIGAALRRMPGSEEMPSRGIRSTMNVTEREANSMREMRESEIREFIQHNKLGVLCLAKEDRAHGVPLYYGYDGKGFYFQTRPGIKQRFIVETREACFTIASVHALDDWASVQVFGTIQRVEGKLDAMEALMSVPLPPGVGETPRGEPDRHDRGMVVYCLTPTRVSGRHSEHAPQSIEEREIAFGGM